MVQIGNHPGCLATPPTLVLVTDKLPGITKDHPDSGTASNIHLYVCAWRDLSLSVTGTLVWKTRLSPSFYPVTRRRHGYRVDMCPHLWDPGMSSLTLFHHVNSAPCQPRPAARKSAAVLALPSLPRARSLTLGSPVQCAGSLIQG